MRRELFQGAAARALVLALVVGGISTVQSAERAWSPRQQATLVEAMRGDDREAMYYAVHTARMLGPERMSEGVHEALPDLLEALNRRLDEAESDGIPGQDVVDGEFFTQFVGFVARLGDPRAIPAIARSAHHGFSRDVIGGLAAFGEQALPALFEVLDSGDRFAAMTCWEAIKAMVADGGAETLSPPARDAIARVVGDGLRSGRGSVVVDAIAIATSLNQPDLVQTVRDLGKDQQALVERGIKQPWLRWIPERAAEALARLPGAP